jgi:translation initiation factor 3 subunit G
MPPIEGAKSKQLGPSWADQMEEGDDGGYERLRNLPAPTEDIKGDTKIVTQYDINEDGKRIKYIRHYKIEKIKVSKSVAVRKSWKKYGKASEDGPGPNPHNTVIQDEIQMDFVKELDAQAAGQTEDPALALKKMGKGFVKCRYCDMDHWSTSCPYKDKLALKSTDKDDALGAAAGMGGGMDKKAGPGGSVGLDSKYVPPSLRDGGNRKGDVMSNARNKDEANTVRVTNLPEDIQDSDIRELFTPFGRISRIFLARDKWTGNSKGFAFVSFEHREDAAKAVATVHGHGYANLILNVEWAKPSGNA